VRAAIERRELSAEHLQNYQKLRKESEFHDLSAQDRRNKNKVFGKFSAHLQKTESRTWPALGAVRRHCRCNQQEKLAYSVFIGIQVRNSLLFQGLFASYR